ncbi:putative tail component protein [uncultured Caudovirales phage]|uniref:Putative tail component protein n=1 Tax=uncultured Caudovirales phage TaxID=2100421 RepID=A0A2H4J736_9CAUD|nr:putative tail component protein [uncultured Caudovirales phage]
MGFEAIDYLNRKKAGMNILCNLIAKDLERQGKNNANWKDRTSHARQGLNSGYESNGDNYSIYLAHGVDYGGILEEGSKPHIITPKNSKALYWKGAAHPVRRVNHPGTKGFKTIENTLNENKPLVIKRVIDYWSD